MYGYISIYICISNATMVDQYCRSGWLVISLKIDGHWDVMTDNMIFKDENEGDDLLAAAVKGICDQFVVTQGQLIAMTNYFIDQMNSGLNEEIGSGLPMIPSFVTALPTGEEQGIVLTAELGGTNFTVSKVTLKGRNQYSIDQMKTRIPDYLFQNYSATSRDLFTFLVKQVDEFMRSHLGDVFTADRKHDQSFKMGFIFSYPVKQTSLDTAELIRWTKRLNIKDTVGKDVIQLFQDELDNQGLNMVNVMALTNDTICTFLSLCYSTRTTDLSAGRDNKIQGDISGPVIGCVFGTGTNGCYKESINNIVKLPRDIKQMLLNMGNTEMLINTEWGSFDNETKILPTSKYDISIDKKYSRNPGYNLFEKRVSGMFLGEILRNILIDLYSRGLMFQQYASYDVLPHQLRTPFQISCQVMASIEIDDTIGLRASEMSLLQSLRILTTPTERAHIQTLTRIISRRAAYLAAVPIAAIIIKTGALEKKYNGEVDVSCEGSIIKYYPGFKTMMRQALALTPLGTDGERRIHLKILEDSPSVGAALCALMA
ncbi:hypothetical protein TPHA_0E03770 [Tetrapisispora phaffii CBS 4417]|uniref:Phosphotransferase n=1 Tax=Tetrapisispora phaffii (strain ATCC 24235 / CBS 4417 / NBRC 1672 / NRRL Y-8282 / UCD 70-5) TaxID=1071381 RepID=G8BU88_TETPH|nr:hypothetical protein TPHA_0E03770 [Tetrapisispora phaffii CBS 4417]CCE63466.1 hypothetical protein TPHA_0E03770 [Tetrapisispora phaffii CBS 4417]